MTKIINLGLVLSIALVAVATPFISHAASVFAYVDQSGEVKTVTADTPWIALATAPNIDEHSGVMLLDSPADNDVVGDDVPSV